MSAPSRLSSTSVSSMTGRQRSRRSIRPSCSRASALISRTGRVVEVGDEVGQPGCGLASRRPSACRSPNPARPSAHRPAGRRAAGGPPGRWDSSVIRPAPGHRDRAAVSVTRLSAASAPPVMITWAGSVGQAAGGVPVRQPLPQHGQPLGQVAVSGQQAGQLLDRPGVRAGHARGGGGGAERHHDRPVDLARPAQPGSPGRSAPTPGSCPSPAGSAGSPGRGAARTRRPPSTG